MKFFFKEMAWLLSSRKSKKMNITTPRTRNLSKVWVWRVWDANTKAMLGRWRTGKCREIVDVSLNVYLQRQEADDRIHFWRIFMQKVSWIHIYSCYMIYQADNFHIYDISHTPTHLTASFMSNVLAGQLLIKFLWCLFIWLKPGSVVPLAMFDQFT